MASLEALLLGAVLAVIVVFIFLRDWRATFITAMAMPLSLIPTFAVMAPMGQSLNIVTLLALSLAIGILVDDAIVEIENIVRHMRDGKPPYDASMEAADEIGLAVVATTATIVAVFAPVGFMPGIIGQFFKAFALAACVSVAFSLVVARTLTPLMAAYLLKHHKHDDTDPFWMAGYLKALTWALRNRWKVFAHRHLSCSSAACFLATKLPFEFFRRRRPSAAPASRSNCRRARPWPRPTPSFSASPATCDARPRSDLRLRLRRRPGGQPGQRLCRPGGQGRSELSQQAFAREMVDQLEDRSPAPGSAPASPSKAAAQATAPTIPSRSCSDDGAAAGRRRPQGRGRDARRPGPGQCRQHGLDRPAARSSSRPAPIRPRLMGVSTSAISQAVRVATIGDVDQNLPKYNLGDRQVPIRLRLTDDAREDLSVIENLRVPTASGTAVPLNAVADIRFGAGPSQILRQDRSRIATDHRRAQRHPQRRRGSRRSTSCRPSRHLPAGVRQAPAGDAEFIQEMITGFAIAFATGILLMYAVLVLLFRSFAYPITIMASLPLAIGGAFVALMVGGSSFSISSLIGVLMLMGIAAKNSILLVDYVIIAEQERHAAPRGHHGRRPQAGAADPDDHLRHGRRACCRSPSAGAPTSSSASRWPSRWSAG